MGQSNSAKAVGSNAGLGRCGTCKHWQRYTEAFDMIYNEAHAGTCNSDRFVYDKKTPENGLHYWGYDSYSAGFDTGENFGCVHWLRCDQPTDASA